MGRAQGPQGGAGNQGGALSSKSAKPRKVKDVMHTRKIKVSKESQPDDEPEPSPAFTVVRPSAQQRSDLMRAHRSGKAVLAQLRARAHAAARQWDGTSPDGEQLGGTSAMEPDELRQARLQHLSRQEEEKRPKPVGKKIAVTTPDSSTNAERKDDKSATLLSPEERQAATDAVAELPRLRRCLDARAEAHADGTVDSEERWEVRERVVLLLEMLAGHLERDAMYNSLKLLGTVLENATKDDPKYRRLKARNEKLWVALLQHAEICALLEVAGFDPQFGVEENDRKAEIDMIQAQLHEILDGGQPEGQTTVDLLLQRIERLELAAPPGDEVTERDATFVHHGGEALCELSDVLKATSGWAQRFRESTSASSNGQ
mmetsp:Transcript_29308/g.39610  ORF Transcript_29308/g.39610 Transcript_29308/m.39610 type:complete len:373 (-) Transcript_29308:122-1240(-)